MKSNLASGERTIQTEQTQVIEDSIQKDQAIDFSNLYAMFGDTTASNEYSEEAALLTSKMNELTKHIDSITTKDASLNQALDYLDDFKKSAIELRDAPRNYRIAKRNYNKFVDGEEVHKRKMKEIIFEQGLQLALVAEDRHLQVIKDTKESVTTYNVNVNLAEKLNALYGIRKNEFNNLKSAIDTQQSSTWTNERKVVYEKSAIQQVQYIRFIIKIIYYILFIVYLIVGDFFTKTRYKNYKAWLLIMTYLLIPQMLNWIIIKLFALKNKIVYFFSNKAPKDVYVDL